MARPRGCSYENAEPDGAAENGSGSSFGFALIEAFIRERGITKVPMGASGPPSGRDEVIEEF